VNESIGREGEGGVLMNRCWYPRHWSRLKISRLTHSIDILSDCRRSDTVSCSIHKKVPPFLDLLDQLARLDQGHVTKLGCIQGYHP